MTTRNGINLKDHSCFICGKVVESAHFPLSSARLETLQKSLLNEIRSQIKQSISGTAVDEEFLCHHCGALLDLVNDLETKLADVRSTLSSLWCKKIRNFFGTSKVIGGECPRVGSCNSLQSGKSYCKSSQNNFQVAELSTGESENQESASLLEEESSSENFCKMCSFSSNSEEMLKFHISSEHKEFVCSECDIVLVSSDELNDHIKEKHLGSVKSTTSTQQNQITMMSCPKEDKVVGRSDVHLVPVFQNMVDSCNDESGFSSADVSSEGLIIHSSKEGSSTKYSEVKYQLLGSRENNINENSITEVKLSEDNENDKNEGLWVSLSSFVDSENLNGPLEENQAIKGEKHTKLFICGKCGYKSFSAPEITEHVASHSGGTSEKVLLDDGGTSSAHPPLLGNVASADSKFSCSYCAWKSNDKLDLRNHINENHSNKNAVYICGFCKKKFTSKLQLTHHEASHGRTKIFRCKICKKGFSRENLLNRHVRFAHSSSKCCFCTKTLHSMEELSEHKSKHEQEDGYQCLECPRIFKTKTGLKFHSAQHTGEYKFRCQYCDQGFMSRVVYQEHMGKHTKEERYICDICGRKFCFQSTYWIHRKWHDTPFPYKCDICDRPFRHSSLLKVHKRQHTGERPYHCPHCSRSFSVSGTLKRHLMLHTGDYAFSCGECEKGFTTRNKFALHLSRVHGNDSLLQQGPPKTEFKMVIRDSPKSPEGKVLEGKVNEEDLIVQNYDELDSMMVQDGGIVGDGADLLKESSLMLPCSILDDVSGSLETRVVEILVNDETSQAVATVTVEGNSSLVSW